MRLDFTGQQIRQAPLSMGFLRQEYWSGLSFPSPGDLLDPGIQPAAPSLAGRFFTTERPEYALAIVIIESLRGCTTSYSAIRLSPGPRFPDSLPSAHSLTERLGKSDAL